MINHLLLVGRIKRMPLLSSMMGDNDLVIEVKRNYKNVEGVFEKDSFKCNLWIAISKKIEICCKEGDMVAIKGRLIDDNGKCNILAEQVILLNKML